MQMDVDIAAHTHTPLPSTFSHPHTCLELVTRPPTVTGSSSPGWPQWQSSHACYSLLEQIEIFPSDRLTKAPPPSHRPAMLRGRKYSLCSLITTLTITKHELICGHGGEEALKAFSHCWISARRSPPPSIPAAFALVLYFSCSLSLSLFAAFISPMLLTASRSTAPAPAPASVWV